VPKQDNNSLNIIPPFLEGIIKKKSQNISAFFL